MVECSLIRDAESGTRNFEAVEVDVVAGTDVSRHVEGFLEDFASELKIPLRFVLVAQNRDARVSEVVIDGASSTLTSNQGNPIFLHVG